MNTVVTREMVVGLWAHLEHHYGSRLLDKESSMDMQLVSRALGQMGILDQRKFMEQYTTTIEDVIYVPFVVGDASTMPLDSQLHVCCHEHQHVVQWRKERGLFLLEYLTDKDKRAHHETEAMQVDLEIDYWLGRESRNLATWPLKLRDYALDDDHIATVSKALSMAYKAIGKGGVWTDVGKFSIAWLNDYQQRQAAIHRE
jgi:hypothetical protein